MSGVGAWLAWFIGLMIVNAILSIIDIFMSASFSYFIFIVSAMYIYVSVRLFTGRRWKVVRQTIILLWIIPVITVILLIVGLVFKDYDFIYALFINEISDIVKSIAFAVMWTLYFAKSTRVSNTYIRDDDNTTEEHFKQKDSCTAESMTLATQWQRLGNMLLDLSFINIVV